ncbi:MAG: GH116 family glycosyl-hydrolase [Anaerolineae bacterium]
MSKADFYGQESLYRRGEAQTYAGEFLGKIAFPLGGIGAGCVSLSGRGALVDWEIFNRPNKGMAVPYAFFGVWARADGEAPVTRVLEAPPEPPFDGSGWGQYGGMGFGVNRENGSGLPHMRSTTFRGEFPLAWVRFEDPALPVEVELEAYSPFIPANADDSSLPVAVLTYRVHNPGPRTVEVSVAGNMANPLGYDHGGSLSGRRVRLGRGQNLNRCVQEDGLTALSMTTERYPATHPRFGTLALATPADGAWCQAAWLRGDWYDMFHDYWDHFSQDGILAPREYPPSPEGFTDVGTLGVRTRLEPGATAEIPFVLAWHFPNYVKYWGEAADQAEEAQPTWLNYYATLWPDALSVARYCVGNAGRLCRETRRFHDTLFESTLPASVLDAISSQASILHSPTVLRLPDGTFYGFEGCHGNAGCCEGTCTHVWNYAQTQAFLFPALERSMRRADYTHNMNADGSMGFRLQLPLGNPPWTFHPAADGQMGGLLKLYRDWKLCGDDAYLRELWPAAKKALEYAWSQWDPDGDGVMTGIQHNTYDIEFYGANTMMGTFYLGALRAAEEMARYLGDTESAERYRHVYEQGQARLESTLYNGEYYVQQFEPELALKYQYGEGCLSDHLIGQWFAHVVGLGYVLEPEHVRSALTAIFEHNWRSDFWEHANPQRIYALNDEQGLLICSWPRGGRPALPFVYSDEVWCGIEYQVAAHLIYEGQVDRGLAIVKGTRGRHDGRRRNPWNEFECGSHYARSMASWSLLTALSGYGFDLGAGVLGFTPRLWPEDFRCFWSADGVWGRYEQRIDQRARAELRVDYGKITLNGLNLGALGSHSLRVARVSGREFPLTARLTDGVLQVRWEESLILVAGETLVLE